MHLLSQEWEIKSHEGRQRKTWSRTIEDILSLDILVRESVDSLYRDGRLCRRKSRTNFEDLSLFRYTILVCE